MMSRDEISNYHLHAANCADLWKGILGSGSSLFAFIVSNMDHIEAWLRIISLCVGIAVGLATLWSIVRRNRAK